MSGRGFEADFSAAVLAEVRDLTPPFRPYDAGVRDMRNLPWCSIDNDDSRDLDQLTVAEARAVGGTGLLVAVADVSTAVTPGSALDRHAAVNTTSIYTPPQNFPMLPDRLSTDLAQKVERLMRKAASACLLGDRIGQEFDGIITGASPKGTWVRVFFFDPPVEGRVEQGGEGLDVGDQVRVKLLRADPERGFIDFSRSGQSRVGPGSSPQAGRSAQRG